MMENPQTSGKAAAAGQDYPLRLTERFGYASGDFACSMYWVVFAQFLMFFYTDIAGLPAAAVATMMAVTRLWDTIDDPVMGLVADRTRSRHGKYRPWLIWMILPMIVSGILIFTIPDASITVKLIYAYITYTLVGIIYSAVNLPYSALMGVMSSNSKERTILASFRYIGSFTGNLVPQLSIFALVAFFGRGNDQFGYASAMACFGLLAGGLFIFTFMTTRERVVVPPKVGSVSVRSDLGYMFRNLPWIVLALVGVLTLVWISIRGASTIYYFKYYVGNQALAATFLAFGTAAAMGGIICTKWMVQLLGDKRRAYMVVNFLAGLTIAVFYFAGPEDIALMFALNVVGAFLVGPLMPLMFALYADAADYGEWKFARRTTGLIFASGTSAIKMGWTFGGSIGGWVLALYGYQANVEQSQETLEGMRALMSWIPALFALLAMILVFFYPIDAKLEETMARDLAKRRGESTPSDSS
jgi:GPH family glycoside/pentoside/hexuronide:cation symporter